MKLETKINRKWWRVRESLFIFARDERFLLKKILIIPLRFIKHLSECERERKVLGLFNQVDGLVIWKELYGPPHPLVRMPEVISGPVDKENWNEFKKFSAFRAVGRKIHSESTFPSSLFIFKNPITRFGKVFQTKRQDLVIPHHFSSSSVALLSFTSFAPTSNEKLAPESPECLSISYQ